MKRVIFVLFLISVFLTFSVCTADMDEDARLLDEWFSKANKQFDAIRYGSADSIGSPLPQESWNYNAGLVLAFYNIFDMQVENSFTAAQNGSDFYGIPNAWLAKGLSEAKTAILMQQVSETSSSKSGKTYSIYAKLILADPQSGEILEYTFTPRVYITEAEKEAFNLMGVESCKDFLVAYADKQSNPNGYKDRYNAAMALYNDQKYYSARQGFIESAYGNWEEMAAKCIRERPATGELWHDPAIWLKDMSLTFRIEQSADTSIFIRLFKDGKAISQVFVAGSGEATVQLPGNGYYTIKDGIGSTWYGTKEAFGPDGSYETMTFDDAGSEKVYLQSGYEYTISINVSGGGTGIGSKDENWDNFAE